MGHPFENGGLGKSSLPRSGRFTGLLRHLELRDVETRECHINQLRVSQSCLHADFGDDTSR